MGHYPILNGFWNKPVTFKWQVYSVDYEPNPSCHTGRQWPHANATLKISGNQPTLHTGLKKWLVVKSRHSTIPYYNNFARLHKEIAIVRLPVMVRSASCPKDIWIVLLFKTSYVTASFSTCKNWVKTGTSLRMYMYLVTILKGIYRGEWNFCKEINSICKTLLTQIWYYITITLKSRQTD